MATALLILESPWWTPAKDIKSASALPFLQGIERLMDNESHTYYATFFQKDDFALALEHLCQTQETRRILYVAAHGAVDALAAGKPVAILKQISLQAKHVEGVIISSCSVGKNDKALATVLQDAKGNNGANWVFSYTCKVGWLASMLVELAILQEVWAGHLLSKDAILEAFSRGLQRFNPDWDIDAGPSKTALRDGFALWVRPQGPAKPADVTSELLRRLKWA